MELDASLSGANPKQLSLESIAEIEGNFRVINRWILVEEQGQTQFNILREYTVVRDHHYAEGRVGRKRCVGEHKERNSKEYQIVEVDDKWAEDQSINDEGNQREDD